MSRVYLGAEVLMENPQRLRGRRIGLATNPTGVDSQLVATVDRLQAAGAELVALYGPEHGVRGDVEAGLKVDSSRDPLTGVPVYSLYGETRIPTPQMLEGVDLFIFDMQDVGARFYTYLYTMTHCMAGTAKAGIPFMVLDRPNPIGLDRIEGPLIEEGFTSFVGLYPVPVRYGLTIGEFARYVHHAFGIGEEPEVIPMQGYHGGMWFDQTGLPWVPPSPNIPSLENAVLYPGTCLIEGTNCSEGRGTTLPFRVLGAPWIDGYRLAGELNKLDLQGVRFRPLSFRPTFSKHKEINCQGVEVHIDRRVFRPLQTQLVILETLIRLYEDFRFLDHKGRYFFDLLMGSSQIRQELLAGSSGLEISHGFRTSEDQFREASQRAWLYPRGDDHA